jgi:hypothetical protein
MGKKLKIFFKALYAQVATDIQPLIKKYLRIVLAILVVLVVFFFFLFSMNRTLRSFNGNYSGFIRISDRFGYESNPLFLIEGAPLLFENSDFEKGTLENWQASGNAFRYQPTKDDNLSARGVSIPSNHQGQYWIGTYEKYQGGKGEIPGTIQGDMPFGEMISTPFIIKEKKIAFLVGGSKWETLCCGLRTYVALEVEGENVLKAAGQNTEMMDLQVWNVAEWLGKTARIVINDQFAEKKLHFKHLNVDYFHYYRENPLRKNLIISPSGYDGTYFYMIAFDPFLRKFQDHPEKYYLLVDEPVYRFSRIGFPLMIHAFSLGKAEWFPKTMMWLILFSHLLGIYFLVRIIMVYGRNPLWGLFYLLIPGFQVSMHMALPESISAAFLLGGIYFYIRKRPLAAVPFFAVSILVRETGGLLVLVIIIFEIIRHKKIRNALILLGSFFPFCAWKLFLTWKLFPVYGLKTLAYSPGDFTLPFSGFIDLFKVIHRGEYLQSIVLPAIYFPLLLVILFVFALFFLKKKCDFLTLGLFSFSLLSLILSYEKIWCHVDNGVRTTYEAFLLLIVVFISRKDEEPSWLKYAFLGLCASILLYDFFFSELAPDFRAGFFLFH